MKTNRKHTQEFDNELSKFSNNIYLITIILLVGLLAVRNTSVTVEKVAKELEFVVNGGQWKPNCQSRKQVLVLIIVYPFFIKLMYKWISTRRKVSSRLSLELVNQRAAS